MTGRTLLLLAVSCLLLGSAMVSGRKNFLRQFIKLVETHNLNVSIVTSRAKYWNNNSLRELRDSVLHLPQNTARVTNSYLSQETGRDWLELSKTTNLESVRGIATYQMANFRSGKLTQILGESTNKDEIPVSPSYEKVTRNQIGERFLKEKPNYTYNHNYTISGPRGFEGNIKVIGANMNVTFLEKSRTMPLSEVTIMKNVLQKYYLSLKNTVFPDICVDALQKQIPNSSWQMVMGTDEYYLHSHKYAVFDIAEMSVIIFSAE